MTLEVLSAERPVLCSLGGGPLSFSELYSSAPMAEEAQAMLTCPYCSSEQPFPLRFRPHEGSDTVIEVYISCPRCPYEHVLRLSTTRLEHLHRLEARLTNQATVQKARYGKPSVVNELAFMRLQQLVDHEEEELREH